MWLLSRCFLDGNAGSERQSENFFLLCTSCHSFLVYDIFSCIFFKATFVTLPLKNRQVFREFRLLLLRGAFAENPLSTNSNLTLLVVWYNSLSVITYCKHCE